MLTRIVPWAASVKFVAIPAAPAIITVPPEITALPLTSSEPFAPDVGPMTVSVPPVISNVPLESTPSPSVFTYILPPVILRMLMPSDCIISPEDVSDTAFIPSSDETIRMFPPFIVIL